MKIILLKTRSKILEENLKYLKYFTRKKDKLETLKIFNYLNETTKNSFSLNKNWHACLMALRQLLHITIYVLWTDLNSLSLYVRK